MNAVILFDDSQSAWLHFQHPEEIVVTHDVAEVQAKLHQIETAVHRRGWYAAGFITYEVNFFLSVEIRICRFMCKRFGI